MYATRAQKVSDDAEFHTDSESAESDTLRALCAELLREKVLTSTHPNY